MVLVSHALLLLLAKPFANRVFFCTKEGGDKIREKRPGEKRKHESHEEQRGAESPDASLVSAGLRDVLGMTPWRKEHPHATWAEIEAAVDEQMNQLRAQLIQEVVQIGGDRGMEPEAGSRASQVYNVWQAAVGARRADAAPSK